MTPAEEERVRRYLRYLMSIGRATSTVAAVVKMGTRDMADSWVRIYEELRGETCA